MEATITAVIIDDEEEAIRLLEIYLRFFPMVKIIGKESDARKGLELVKHHLPELVFLDIDMPEMNGLKVAEQIHFDNYYSEIVFTTAHQHYAFDALDIQPLDFLTKPFNVDDLRVVLNKYYERNEQKEYSRKIGLFLNSQENAPKIKLPTTNGVLMVDIDDIVCVKAASNNCEIYLKDGTKEAIIRNLGGTLDLIGSPKLFRFSRSIYVNLDFIARIDRKNLKCVVTFNHSILEEDISRSSLKLFEKLGYTTDQPLN